MHPCHLTYDKPTADLCSPCQQELLTREIENYQGLLDVWEVSLVLQSPSYMKMQ